MKIYIAGPITGKLEYRKKFMAAERRLRRKGHIVVNPATLPDGLGEARRYMKICFAMLDCCDAVYFLQGWEESVGAKEEWEYAKVKGKMLFYELSYVATECSKKRR